MQAKKQQISRPFSRLDNIIEAKPIKNFISIAGIPQKNRSGSKNFPSITDNDSCKQNNYDKQNIGFLAPKKQ